MSDPFWLVLWLVCGFMAGGLEVIALFSPGEGDTLSENIRAVTRRPWIRWPTFAGWGLFSVWFAAHIWL